MEWVETTGSTVEEAKEAALDQLGVDERGRRVRGPRGAQAGPVRAESVARPGCGPASVRPAPGPRSSGVTAASRSSGTSGGGRRARPRRRPRPAPTPRRATDEAAAAEPHADRTGGVSRSVHREAPLPAVRGGSRTADDPPSREMHPCPTTDVDLDAHSRHHQRVPRRPGRRLRPRGARSRPDRSTRRPSRCRSRATTSGCSIGPKGHTLTAIQELTRTVVQRRVPGTAPGRVRLDVGGYRQRRREALERFTQRWPTRCKSSGVQKALEPMNAADRKVVHDTVNEIDGVQHGLRGRGPASPGGHRPGMIGPVRRSIPMAPLRRGHRRFRTGEPVIPSPALTAVLERARRSVSSAPVRSRPTSTMPPGSSTRSRGRAGSLVVDLGSGAGFRPGGGRSQAGLELVLLDAMEKRTAFLDDAVAAWVSADRVRVVTGRAEVLGRDDGLRGRSAGAVTARSSGRRPSPPSAPLPCCGRRPPRGERATRRARIGGRRTGSPSSAWCSDDRTSPG